MGTSDTVLRDLGSLPPEELAVDLLKQRDMDRAVQVALKELTTIHSGGRDLPTLYNKSLVILASRYVLVKDVQNALQVLTLIPRQFFTAELPKLMENDDEFAALAVRVADAIVAAGIVEVVYHHNPAAEIQPTGVA